MSGIQFFIGSMENILSQNYFSHFNCDEILGHGLLIFTSD